VESAGEEEESGFDFSCRHHQHVLLFFILGQMGLIQQLGSTLLGPMTLLAAVLAFFRLLGLDRSVT
jgi:hypothetical protein